MYKRQVKRVKDSGKGGKGVGARLDHFTHDIDLDSTDAAECQTDVYKRQGLFIFISTFPIVYLLTTHSFIPSK